MQFSREEGVDSLKKRLNSGVEFPWSSTSAGDKREGSLVIIEKGCGENINQTWCADVFQKLSFTKDILNLFISSGLQIRTPRGMS